MYLEFAIYDVISDLVALAPKRPDWDLKRAIEPQLEKLKKKTERAIAELIRERLKATNDLAAQVAAAGPDMYWKFYCPKTNSPWKSEIKKSEKKNDKVWF